MKPADAMALRTKVATFLVDSGYSPLGNPFVVGSIEFELEGVFIGPSGTLSLVIVQDGPTNREESSRLYWLVQRVARALDATGSRVSVTVVLIGGEPDDRLIGELQGLSRVLPIHDQVPISRSLAPLSRIAVDVVGHSFSNGLDLLANFASQRQDAPGLVSLVKAAPRGSEFVEGKLRGWLESAIEGPQ